MAVPLSQMMMLWQALGPDATCCTLMLFNEEMLCGSHKFGPPALAVNQKK